MRTRGTVEFWVARRGWTIECHRLVASKAERASEVREGRCAVSFGGPVTFGRAPLEMRGSSTPVLGQPLEPHLEQNIS